jgi:hypothetical protein
MYLSEACTGLSFRAAVVPFGVLEIYQPLVVKRRYLDCSQAKLK